MNKCMVNTDNRLTVSPGPAVVTLEQALINRIGEEIHLSDWYRVDQSCIENFAQVTGDNQWIHVEVERARRESPFRSTVAQGFLILSLLPTMRALEDDITSSYPDARLVVNCGLNNVRFLNAVKADTCIRTRTRLLDIIANKRSLDIIEENRVEMQGRGKCACIVETRVRVYL